MRDAGLVAILNRVQSPRRISKNSMFNFLKNITKSANRYDRLNDAQVEQIGLKYHIPGGLANGVFDRQYVIDELLKRDELNGSKLAVIISLLSLLISIVIFPLNSYLNLLQIKDLSQNQDTRYIDYTLSFDEKLNKNPSLGIMNAIEDGKPILQENGGKFSTHDLDNFLGLYNQLSDVRNHNLVTDELIENNFSDGLLKAHANKEIKNYLQKIRIEDDTYFIGFDELVDLFKK